MDSWASSPTSAARPGASAATPRANPKPSRNRRGARAPLEIPMSAYPPISTRPSLKVASALLSSADLPTADLTDEHCRHFFFLGDSESPTGLVGLEMLGDVAL